MTEIERDKVAVTRKERPELIRSGNERKDRAPYLDELDERPRRARRGDNPFDDMFDDPEV